MSFFYIIHIAVCVLLVLVILFQDGKTGGLVSVADTGNSVFGARGASSFLTKLTSGIAVTFMITSVFLAFLNAPGDQSIADDYTPPPQTNSSTVNPQPQDGTTPTGQPGAAVDADGNVITLDKAMEGAQVDIISDPSQVPDEVKQDHQRVTDKAAAEKKAKEEAAKKATEKKNEKPKTDDQKKDTEKKDQ